MTEGIAHPLLVGDRRRIVAIAGDTGVDLNGITILDPNGSPLSKPFAHELFSLRQAKGMSRDAAALEVCKPLCFANMLVRMGLADGFVSGARHTTADVVRSAIQLIGMIRRSSWSPASSS